MLNVFQSPRRMSETTKGPSHPQLVTSIQGLSSNRSAELRKAITNSNVAQDSNSKGEVVVRDLIEALGEDAVSVVGGITSDASETSRKEPFSSSENFCWTS